MAVIQMSERELSRLRVMIDLTDGRLTVEAAGVPGESGEKTYRAIKAARKSSSQPAVLRLSRNEALPGAFRMRL
jgi:Mg-chelatase subunit ChlD